MQTELKVLPILFKRTNTGAIQFWEVAHGLEGEAGKVVTRFGQLGTDSPQETVDLIKEGKNIGRSNETTPYSQAALQAKQHWDKKRKAGYTEDKKQAEAGDKGLPSIDPMLAHKWKDHGKKMEYPCYAQPKLDGLRAICVVESGVARFYSRTRKPFKTIPHLEAQVQTLCRLNGISDAIFDGELYTHEYKHDFNKIVSIIKRDEVHEDVNKMEYHIYDLPSSSNVEFKDRTLMLSQYLNKPEGSAIHKQCYSLVYVETVKCKGGENVVPLFENFLAQGYEGLMLRSSESFYENKRSKHLLKYKEFVDDEFKVVGVQEGKGKLMGHAGSFVCLTPDGKRFNAKLKGELSNLKEYFENFDKKYVGKTLTVEYFGLTPDGAPRFPVALRFRDSE